MAKERMISEAEEEKILTEAGEIEAIQDAEETESEVGIKLLRKRRKATDGRVYSEFFVDATVRGVAVKITFVPKAINRKGYEMVDIVFGDKDEVRLLVTKGKRIDEATKRRVAFTRYEAYSVDEATGLPYNVFVKPEFDSDAALLDAYIREQEYFKAKASESAAASGE